MQPILHRLQYGRQRIVVTLNVGQRVDFDHPLSRIESQVSLVAEQGLQAVACHAARGKLTFEKSSKK